MDIPLTLHYLLECLPLVDIENFFCLIVFLADDQEGVNP